jgi:hypothetical protein
VHSGEPAGDRRARQVHHGVHLGQQVRRRVLRIPLPLVGTGGGPAHQPDHPVPAAGEHRGERGADQPGRAGDGDHELPASGLGGVAVRREVVGELAVPVDERRPQQRCRHRGVDTVADHGAAPTRVGEVVGVPPPADHPRRQ